MSTVTYTEIVQLVTDHLPEDAGPVEAETTFEQLDLDSLVLLELAVLLENRYGIVVNDGQLFEAGTFGAIADLVNRQLQESSANTVNSLP